MFHQRDSVFRRKYDPLLAEIELQAFIKSQYPSSGLRTKQQVDKLLAERNELIQKLMREVIPTFHLFVLLPDV